MHTVKLYNKLFCHNFTQQNKSVNNEDKTVILAEHLQLKDVYQN